MQSTNGVIKIKVSPPEANQVRKMWIADLRFKYILVIWENASNPEVSFCFVLLFKLNITVRDVL